MSAGQRGDRRGTPLPRLRLPPPTRGRHRRLRLLQRTPRRTHLRPAPTPNRLHPTQGTDLQRRGGAPPLRASSSRSPTASRPRRPPRPRRRRATPTALASSSPTATAATIRIANVGRRRRKDENDRGFWLDTLGGPVAVRQAGQDTPPSTPTTSRPISPTSAEGQGHPLRRGPPQHRRPAPDPPRRRGHRHHFATPSNAAPRPWFQLEDSELDHRRSPRPRRPRPDAVHRVRRRRRRSPAPPGPRTRRDRRRSPARRCEIAATSTRTPATTSTTPPAPASAARRPATTACCPTATSIDHALIDRHAVRDLLLDLAGSATAGAGGRTRGAQRDLLDALADSSLERRSSTWLDERGLRLPDRAQVTVTDARARPDLVYDLPTGPVAVFVDGPVHDGRTRPNATPPLRSA